MTTTGSTHRSVQQNLKLAFARYLSSFVFLIFFAIWTPSVFATTTCEIQAGTPSSANVAPNGTTNFTVNVVNTGACGPTVNLSWTISGDTTGSASTSVAAAVNQPIAPFNFTATAGGAPNGTATITVTCTAGCVNGPTTAIFTINTNNNYVFNATSPTTVTTNQATPFTLSTNLLVNGTGSGATYSTNFLTLPSGPSLGTVVNSVAGNASITSQVFTAGTQNIQAQVVCPPTALGCPPAPVPFTVIVEPVAMTNSSPTAVTIPAGGSTTLIARYGSANSTANAGYSGVLTWAINSGNPPGNGALSGGTGINAIGLTQINFTATVPGIYTVRASTNDTFSSDPSEIFTITVTAAVTRTLSVSSGNAQTAATNTTLPLPLVALAQDNGVNAAGIIINWSTTGGTLSSATSTTNLAGLANVSLTLPATAGAVTVTARRADDLSIFTTFTATSSLTRTLTIASGNNQNGNPGSALAAPLIVLAQDNGVAVTGIPINWTISAGSTLGAAVTNTTASGQATNTVTLGATPGVVTITAARQDNPTQLISFTVNTVSLASLPNLSAQQLAMATALDGICTRLGALPPLTTAQVDFLARCNELNNNIANNPTAVVAALQALLPDTQAAQARASLLTASHQFEAINNRIAALRSGTHGGSFDGLALNGPQGGSISLGGLINGLMENTATNTEVGNDFQRWGFFISGSIGGGDAKAVGITPSYDFDVKALTLGLDYRYSDTFIFGAALGYNQQDTKLAPGQGGVDATSYTLTAYSTYFKNDSWYTDAALTFGKNNYDLVRQINYTIPDGSGGFTNVNQTARSDSGGDLLSFGLTFGRDFQKGGWSIGPYGRILYTKLDFDRIQEVLVSTGPGAGLALIVEERSIDSLASILGAKFTKPISMNWGVLTPHFQVEWEHEFNSDPGSVTARFVNDPSGTTIVLSDSAYDDSYFRIGLGLSAIMSKGRSAYMYYDRAVARDGIRQDNLALGIRLEF
jgi:uncharacterized protein with beta-barrel porin domain